MNGYCEQNNGILLRNTDFWLNMQVVRLLARVAFICNVCFLLASFIQWLPHPPEGELISDIIVLGYIGSLLINVVVNASVIILFVIGRLRDAAIPLWLLVVNLLFFVLQMVVLIINQK
jgi:uncharacterized membrane protein YhaH (DUF805 family)